MPLEGNQEPNLLQRTGHKEKKIEEREKMSYLLLFVQHPAEALIRLLKAEKNNIRADLITQQAQEPLQRDLISAPKDATNRKGLAAAASKGK